MGAIFSENCFLEELDISSTRACDEGLEHLFDGLTSNEGNRLRYLYLSGEICVGIVVPFFFLSLSLSLNEKASLVESKVESSFRVVYKNRDCRCLHIFFLSHP